MKHLPMFFFLAAICGTVPAWDSVLGNHPLPASKDFPMGKARLSVGEFKGEKDVTSSATVVSFTMPSSRGRPCCVAPSQDDSCQEIYGDNLGIIRHLANVS